MNKDIKILGKENLVKRSGFIVVNTDNESYNKYIKSREADETIKTEIQELKNDMQDIKSLLKEMIKKHG